MTPTSEPPLSATTRGNQRAQLKALAEKKLRPLLTDMPISDQNRYMAQLCNELYKQNGSATNFTLIPVSAAGKLITLAKVAHDYYPAADTLPTYYLLSRQLMMLSGQYPYTDRLLNHLLNPVHSPHLPALLLLAMTDSQEFIRVTLTMYLYALDMPHAKNAPFTISVLQSLLGHATSDC